MKIILAKLNTDPPHSLTRKDIKLIFGLVPEDWCTLISQVVLSAELFENSRFDRPVIHSSISSRLNILSRGFSREKIAKEVLRELGLNGGLAQSGFADHLSKSQLSKLDRKIEPYFEAFINAET